MTLRNPFKKKPEKKADRAPAPQAAAQSRTRPVTPAPQQAADQPLLYQYVAPAPAPAPDPCPPTTSHHGSSHSYDGGSSHSSSSYDSGGSSGSSSSYDSGSSGCDSGGGF